MEKEHDDYTLRVIIVFFFVRSGCADQHVMHTLRFPSLSVVHSILASMLFRRSAVDCRPMPSVVDGAVAEETEDAEAPLSVSVRTTVEFFIFKSREKRVIWACLMRLVTCSCTIR